MRRASRTDANQREIVKALREFGCTIVDLSAVGRGCPDILVGFQGRNVLLELKLPGKASRLNAVQRRWHNEWQGQAGVVRCVGAALDALGIKECKSL